MLNFMYCVFLSVFVGVFAVLEFSSCVNGGALFSCFFVVAPVLAEYILRFYYSLLFVTFLIYYYIFIRFMLF